MEFTKENVLNLTDKWIKNITGSFQDLKNEIKELDDTPEKVVVPKCFDEWYSEIKNRFTYKESGKKYALWKINQFGFGCWLQDVNGENIDKEAEVSKWVSSNTMIAVDAVLNGYEVEKEPRYEVIIAGRNLLKLFRGRIDHEFAEKTELCAWAKAAYQLTEQEIKEIDERFWPFAVPAND